MVGKQFSEHHSLHYSEKLGYRSIIFHDIRMSGMPADLHIGGEDFQRKDEFHCTLVSLKRIARSIDADSYEVADARIQELFEEFIATNPLSELKLTDDYRIVSDLGTKTIVVLIELDGLEEFFELLREKFDVEIPSQPPHITLYVQDGHPGIPINSATQLAEISTSVEVTFEAKIDE